MRLLSALALALCVACLCAPAAAQQADPVREHYRAYRAALDGGDDRTAAMEAERALAASEAASGDGGSTPVLALNLATARIGIGDFAGALAPAQRAHAFALAGARGVDPMIAGLLLGRIEVMTGAQAGADRLSALLISDELSAAPPAEIYPAAAALGAWAQQQGQYELAEHAWSKAASYAAGSPFGQSFGLAQARTWQAAAIFRDEIGRRGSRRMNPARAHEAYGLLSQAVLVLGPMSEVEARNLELTFAQVAFAQTLAWRGAIRAKLIADRQPIPEEPVEAQGDADGMAELAPRDITLPRCLLDADLGVRDPTRLYPQDEVEMGAVGSVVVRFRLDEAGGNLSHNVVAYAGSAAFAESIDSVAGAWRFTRRAESPEHCRMPVNVLRTVIFSVRS